MQRGHEELLFPVWLSKLFIYLFTLVPAEFQKQQGQIPAPRSLQYAFKSERERGGEGRIKVSRHDYYLPIVLHWRERSLGLNRKGRSREGM